MNTSKPPYDFEKIISAFEIEADPDSLKPFGTGHINDTFYLANKNPSGKDYLLQRINHFVFKDIEALTNNILTVTEHLRKKLGNMSDVENRVLTLLPAKDKKHFYRDESGNYWRLCYFLNDTHTYDLVETEQQAFEGGKAFGEFQALLSDLKPALLTETIPHFHDIEKRLQQLQDAIKNNKAGRVKEVSAELDFIGQNTAQVLVIPEMARAGKLPKRIIHYDTKFSNVLLDSRDQAQCVIDLDTVMPGYVASDFGDAMRTLGNTASEDENDLEKIQINLPLFKAYTQGYFSTAGPFLTEPEVESLVHGVFLLPFMQAVRFLTDYLEGDIYYKTHFAGHNLQRTKAQLRLFRQFRENEKALRSIIKEEAGKILITGK